MITPIRTMAVALCLLAGAAACEDEEDDVVFRATLSGGAENPARSTSASGTAEFRLSENNTLSYTVDVTNLSNITAGHIHGPATTVENAGVIIGLFSTPPSTSPFTGRLAEGTITSTSTLAGMDFDSLLVLLDNGRAYVNLHTNDGVDPPNTGAGDFPGGEIRGQITRGP
jgi:hypothetical protein